MIPGHGEDIALHIKLVRVAHDPVSEVFNQLVAELHFLSKREVVTSHHHGFNQLTDLRLYLYRMDRRVQMPDVSDSCTDN